jgi:hypothetical protein
VTLRNPFSRLIGTREDNETDEESDSFPIVPPAPYYLVSAAGQPNFGDELITRAWLQYLAERAPDIDVWLDCPEPGRAAHLFRDAHPRLRTTNTLWDLAHLPEYAGAAGAPAIERTIVELGSPKLDAGLAALRTMASIHLLGGGYITSVWPRHLGVLIGAIAVHRHFGVPVFATGQGWTPMDDFDREWVASQLDQLDVAEARDERTAAVFGLELGLDDAYLAYAMDPAMLRDDDAPDVMLLIQNELVDRLGREETLTLVRRFLDANAPEGVSVGVVEGIPPDDFWLLEEVRRLRPDVEPYPFSRLWAEGFPARPEQKWLTTRFHAHLVAAAAGASGTVLSAIADYYDTKHALLIENGTRWNIAPLGAEAASVTLPVSSDPAFPERVLGFAARKRALADQIYPAG